MKAIITVGLGFGDEGKGATIDWLTREMDASLVVRYGGGAQAGHNVQLPDGRRHTFSQFGAGTLAGADTYLGPQMILCPMTMQPEADHLAELGVHDPWSCIQAHPDCLIATNYHIAMNRLRERARGDERHGSCGLGIGETRHYWHRNGDDAIRATDLHDRRCLVNKLRLLRERFLLEMQTLDSIDPDICDELRFRRVNEEADELIRSFERLALIPRMPQRDVVLMEGSQGILLDEWFGFHPYTTWSTVTAQPALELVSEYPECETSVLGITRAYSTRHGAGPFPTECPAMSNAMIDPGNPRNDWQGGIRFGPLDMVLLSYAAAVESLDGIVVTCLDELPDRVRIVKEYEESGWLPIPSTLAEQESLGRELFKKTPVVRNLSKPELVEEVASIAPVVAVAEGPTYESRQWNTREAWSPFAPRR